MSHQYENAKEILMKKAQELGVEADKLSMQAMASLSRAPYIDALLLQNKGEQDIDKLCTAKTPKPYGAIPQHYKSIIDDKKDNKLHMRVQARLLKLKVLQSKVSAPSSYSGIKEVQQPDGYLPGKSDVDHAESQMRKISSEIIGLETVLDQVENNFKKAGKALRENWRAITKQNIKIWFSKK